MVGLVSIVDGLFTACAIYTIYMYARGGLLFGSAGRVRRSSLNVLSDVEDQDKSARLVWAKGAR